MATSGESRKRLGADGERLVRAYLERLGWRTLAANFRCPEGEIDLIAEETTERGVVLVFIEVKTRRGGRQGTPAEAVNARKQQKLISTAQHYLAQRNQGGEEPACRFDIAEVLVGRDGLAKIELRRASFGADN